MSGDVPHAHYRFAVLIGGDGPSRALRARFHDVSGLLWPPVPRPTRGAAPLPAPRKVAGIHEVPDIVLRRGEFRDGGGLYQWLQGIQERGRGTLRTVTVQLLDEAHPKRVLQQWKLSNASVVRYTGPELNAKAADVAIEELVLAAERIDID